MSHDSETLKFNEIFDHIISAVKAHVPNTQDAHDFCKKLQDNKVAICKTYTDLKTVVRNRYMKKTRNDYLDRHKCAAAFMIALLYRFDIEDTNRRREKFAAFVGMLLLKIFIWKDCKDGGNMGLIETINRNNGLKYPPCVCDEQYDYLHNWLTEMYSARDEDKMFILSLSNELFMIETFNRQLAEIHLLSSKGAE